jgi:hypothetical protein
MDAKKARNAGPAKILLATRLNEGENRTNPRPELAPFTDASSDASSVEQGL